MSVWEVLFILSCLALGHSYVFFPLWIKFKAAAAKPVESPALAEPASLVSIVIAAYNEEQVIERKIHSTFLSTYPSDKIEVLIGSDASSDRTNAIIRSLQGQYPSLQLVEFKARTGKPEICNQLIAKAKSEIVILTDANVFFYPHTIPQLVQHFADPSVGVVAGMIQNPNLKADGISVQESAYLARENKLKYYEGKAFGAMMGAFGGCYAIRKAAYQPVPAGFVVDDFYITMQALSTGFKALLEPKATCEEDVSNQLKEEFRRKIRIAKGNFQNLRAFSSWLAKPFSAIGFVFISHKVLRWLGPLFLLLMLGSSFAFANYSFYHTLVLSLQLWAMSLILVDALLRMAGVHLRVLRFVTHFYSMNLALAIGFFQSLRGKSKQTSNWKPTKRFQD